jgi:signal transduction histidine kinase
MEARTSAYDPAGSTTTSAHRTMPGVAATIRRERGLVVHAGIALATNVMLVVIWALTWRGYFWPAWTMVALGLPVVLHASIRLALRARRPRSRALLVHAAITGTLVLSQVLIWAIVGGGYFWPGWVMLALGFPLIVHALVVLPSLVGDGERAELAQRVDMLTRTRAGAVDVQAAELQRIERDLHDGAQAKLVALAISLGLAEEKLEDDPEGARKLVASARDEAREALTELRDLARGIYPPVLQDRGLGAAVRALAAQSPLAVEAAVELDRRLPPPIEAAAYFVVAEALANAAKHARAANASVLVTLESGVLALTVGDDGAGGADPNGSGLSGLRKRVEALDGTFTLESPAGGPTILRAEIPCAS